MRVQILSDLHVGFGNAIPPLAPDATIVVMAGDLAPACMHRVSEAAGKWAGAERILYVPGNHEFYYSDIEEARLELARDCERYGVTLLDTGAITVGQVRFVGAALWTDFRLEGVVGETAAHLAVEAELNDFTGSIRDRDAPDGFLTTQATARRHAEDRAFIEAEMAAAREAGLKTVVVTHHAPSPRCIHPRYAGSRLNAGFASDLERLIECFEPVLWIHGHTHNPVDMTIGRTRIVANPHGYDEGEAENFQPLLTIEV